MRPWIKLLAVVLICLAAIGFYRGWFRLSSSNPEAEGNVGVSVDQSKMKTDIKKAEKKVGKEVKVLEGDLKTKKAEE